MKRDFGQLFKDSLKEYKENFKYFLIVIGLFIFIPSLIGFFVAVPFNIQISKIAPILNNTIQTTPDDFFKVAFNGFPWTLLGIVLIWSLISFLLYIFGSVIMLCGVLDKRVIDLKNSLINAKTNYFRYLWFVIVVCVFIFGLCLLLIVPAIIFGIYWTFAAMVFIDKRKGIIDSLKESFNIVKGKWWITFGYLILFGLIFLVFSWVINMLNASLTIMINPGMLVVNSGKIPSDYFLASVWYLSGIIHLVFNFISNLIVIPMGLLFLKNMYVDRKAG